MSETKFQVGDKVEAFGREGVVTEMCETDGIFKVDFDVAYRWFSQDGKLDSWHKEPSLKLIERPKKKVTKTMYQAIIYEGGPHQPYLTRGIYTKGDAESLEYFIALGPTITFEVEE